jgi:hypothetical protein
MAADIGEAARGVWAALKDSAGESVLLDGMSVEAEASAEG